MTNIRSRVRIVTYVTAALVICAGMALHGYYQSQKYKTALEMSYLRAAEDLTSYTENISAALEKGMYCGTPEQLNNLTAKLWKESAAAKVSLSQLPTSRFNLEKTYKFLAQVGEYAVSLSKKAANGGTVTVQEKENLKKLAQYANSLEESMLVIQDTLRNGGRIGFDDAVAINATTQNSPPNVAEDLAEFEEGFTAYPTLIYDGPFSDHLQQKEPEMLKGAEEFSRAKAREKAAGAFNVDSGKLINNGDEEGNMPSYSFTFGEREISITKKGNYISYMTDPKLVTTRKMTAEDAVHKAENYLNWLEIPDMTMTYYEIADNILTANFAAVQNGMTVYPDLIKVGVAMDNGGIVSYDARGYLTNHMKRELSAPKLSSAEARKSVSSLLTIKGEKLAVIPSDGKNERTCYEFQCKSEEGDDLLVYVNCENGREEQILILIISENGTLTI